MSSIQQVDTGGQFGKNEMNPQGRVPTIVDTDGLLLYESHAIVRYLCAKYGGETSLWQDDPGTRARGDIFMDLFSQLSPDMVTVFWNLIRTAPEDRDMEAVAEAAKRLGQEWAKIEKVLENQDWLGGDQFTMGDIPLGCFANRYFQLDIERPSLPKVEAWYGRLEQRPAYAEHVSGLAMS